MRLDHAEELFGDLPRYRIRSRSPSRSIEEAARVPRAEPDRRVMQHRSIRRMTGAEKINDDRKKTKASRIKHVKRRMAGLSQQEKVPQEAQKSKNRACEKRRSIPYRKSRMRQYASTCFEARR